jgi:hypothetical protein
MPLLADKNILPYFKGIIRASAVSRIGSTLASFFEESCDEVPGNLHPP